LISFYDVGYKVSDFKSEKKIFTGLNVNFLKDERVGIYAASGSGKSTLAKLISGIESPTEGNIYRNGKVSWPIGFAGFFHPELSGYDNVLLISQMAQVDPYKMISICKQIGLLREEMSRPLKKFSPASRAILGYCCSISTSADIYVADEVISVGDSTMRLKCDAYINILLENSSLIFISKNLNQLKKYCNKFYVLINSNLIECSSLDVADKAIKDWNNALMQDVKL